MNDPGRNRAIIDSTSRWGRIATALIAVGIAATIFRVAWLKLDPGEKFGARSGAEARVRYEERFRGEISDRNGRTLAIDSPCWRLAVDPAYFCSHGHRKVMRAAEEDQGTDRGTSPRLPEIAFDERMTTLVGPLDLAREHLRALKIRTLAQKLDDLIGLSKRETSRKLLQAPASRQYLVLDKLLEEWQVDAIRSWLDGRNLGILLEKRTERRYFGPESLQMIVGKCRDNGVGGSGLEQQRNANLQSTRGTLNTRNTNRGAVISIPMGTYDRGSHGENFSLTIDAKIQLFAEKRLREQLEQYDAGGGRCLVVDPHNGDILAMVDILRRRPGHHEVILDDPQRRTEPSLARNRNIVDAFEPGSTFKPFMWAGALELGVGGPGRPVDLSKVNEHPISIPGRRTTVKDAGRVRPYKGNVRNIEYILEKSLNTGMAEMVRTLTDEEARAILTRFGFGSRTQCGLGGSAEHPGQITPLKRWSFANTTISVSFGHEVAVTTLQMTRAFSAFCTGGSMPQLRIARPVDDGQEDSMVDVAQRLMVRALDSETASRTKGALERVVKTGTLKNHGRSSLYTMFGKSGTADLPNPKGGYFKNRHTSNVIAAAPFNRPKIVVYCVIDDPDRKKGYYGGLVAGPVVRDVIDQTLHYMGLEPDVPGADQRRLASLGLEDDLASFHVDGE
jgi:cell division protein FtsI/penicillin-binding protein 2